LISGAVLELAPISEYINKGVLEKTNNGDDGPVVFDSDIDTDTKSL
jgi:hypothetical protein